MPTARPVSRGGRSTLLSGPDSPGADLLCRRPDPVDYPFGLIMFPKFGPGASDRLEGLRHRALHGHGWWRCVSLSRRVVPAADDLKGNLENEDDDRARGRSTGPPLSADTSTGPALRRNALGFPQLLAQSVALISPTMTAVLILPLAYSIAGDATWFSYAFATVMLLFTTLALNQFAKRSATTGSMYAYIARGLGAGCGRDLRLGADLVLLLHRHGRAVWLRPDEPAVPRRDRAQRDGAAVLLLGGQCRDRRPMSRSRTCACRRC